MRKTKVSRHVPEVRTRKEIGKEAARRLLGCTDSEFFKWMADGTLEVAVTARGRICTDIASIERAANTN